MDVDKL